MFSEELGGEESYQGIERMMESMRKRILRLYGNRFRTSDKRLMNQTYQVLCDRLRVPDEWLKDLEKKEGRTDLETIRLNQEDILNQTKYRSQYNNLMGFHEEQIQNS